MTIYGRLKKSAKKELTKNYRYLMFIFSGLALKVR